MNRRRCPALLAGIPAIPALVAAILALSAVAWPQTVDSQEPDTESSRIVGTVTDSLRGTVLAGATVQLLPSQRSTVTDSAGAFVFDELAGGRYRLGFTHPDVPAWVSQEREAVVPVGEDETARILLSTPSAETLVGEHCPGERLAAVTVRDVLTMAPVPMAEVVVRPGPAGGATAVARADARGEHRLCVDPDQDSLTFQARLGGAESRPAPSAMDASFVPRTIFLRATPPSLIEGVVVEEETGESIADVTVGLAGSRARSVSDDDGRFVLPGVPPGEVTLVAEHIGYGEARGEILVGVADTLTVEILLTRAAVELSPLMVEVRSSAAARRMEVASRVDALSRAEIDALLPRVTDVAGLLRNARFPGLQVKEVRYLDEHTGMMVPGVCIEVGRRQARYDRTCEGMVSVYVNGVRQPGADVLLQSLPPGAIESIRVLSPLEAGVQYGGGPGARNGVLLITTR